MVQESKVVVTNTEDAQAQGQTPEEIITPYPTADLVLDVETLNWLVIYFPTDWSHYGVMYSTRLALIDAKTKTATMEASCSRRPKKQSDSPTCDELLKDQAARLKSLIKAAAESCREELSAKLWRVTEKQGQTK